MPGHTNQLGLAQVFVFSTPGHTSQLGLAHVFFSSPSFTKQLGPSCCVFFSSPSFTKQLGQVGTRVCSSTPGHAINLGLYTCCYVFFQLQVTQTNCVLHTCCCLLSTPGTHFNLVLHYVFRPLCCQ